MSVSRQPQHQRAVYRAPQVLMAASVLLGIACADAPPKDGEISRTPSCENCTIVAEKILSLGGANDSVLLSSNTLVSRDARGQYIVKGFDGHNLVVFDSTGRYLRAVGRAGGGPEEFTRISTFEIGNADSLLIFQSSRVTVQSPTFEFARTFQLPVEFEGVLPMSNGNLLVRQGECQNRLGQQCGGPTPRVLVVSPTGEIVGSVGEDSSTQGTKCHGCSRRILALSGAPDRVWLGVPNDYSLQLWDVSGSRVRTLRQSVDWFTTWDSEPAGEPLLTDVMSRPSLGRMYEDSLGRLWTQVVVPDPKYLPPSEPKQRQDNPDFRADPNRFMAAVLRELHEEAAARTITYFEVIDTRAARLVVSAEMPDGLGLMSDGRAYSLREDADGVVHFDIFRLVIRPRP